MDVSSVRRTMLLEAKIRNLVRLMRDTEDEIITLVKQDRNPTYEVGKLMGLAEASKIIFELPPRSEVNLVISGN